jgi:DNA-binding PadR family transcriptional regulator
MTGYDLKNAAFDESINHFWPADQAQIYRTLDKLAEQGLVTSQIELQQDRPNRKVYAITDAGREELGRWLLVTHALPAHREPFLIQLFFGSNLNNAQLIAHLEGQLHQHEALLRLYEQIEIDSCPDPAIDRALELRRMALDLGMLQEKAYIEWATRCLKIMQALPDTPIALELLYGTNDRSESS